MRLAAGARPRGWRSSWCGWSSRGQHEEQAAVVVIGGEDVSLRSLGTVPFGVHDHRLVEDANPPLERGGDVVASLVELELEDLVHGAPDHVEVTEPGEFPRAAPGADQAGLLVEDEEGGVRGRVVVVQQLEQEAESAALACLRAGLEPGGALGGFAAVAAVGTDEDRHERSRVGPCLNGRLEQALGAATRWLE